MLSWFNRTVIAGRWSTGCRTLEGWVSLGVLGEASDIFRSATAASTTSSAMPSLLTCTTLPWNPAAVGNGVGLEIFLTGKFHCSECRLRASGEDRDEILRLRGGEGACVKCPLLAQVSRSDNLIRCVSDPPCCVSVVLLWYPNNRRLRWVACGLDMP